MASIMTKHGNLDNIVTNEFICDTIADMQAINPREATMGSVAIVISGATGLEVYMRNGQKQWINIGAFSGNGGNGDGGSSSTDGPSSNIVGTGVAGSMIIHDDASAPTTNTAAEPTVDVGQADSMVLSE